MRRKRTRWTPEMDEFLVKKRGEKMSFERIAIILDVPRIMASKRYRALCPDAPKPTSRNRKHSQETRNTVVTMRQQGYSFPYIAALVNLRHGQVQGIWNTWRYYHQPRRVAA